MQPSFRVDLLPAGDGDCIWVTCRSAEGRFNLLVDGGRLPTFDYIRQRLQQSADDIDLLVLSHVDADHLEGAIPLLADPRSAPRVRGVWFNGFSQIRQLELQGQDDPYRSFLQGDFISGLLQVRGLTQRASQQAIHVPESGPLPNRSLPGGLRLTVLSPRTDDLLRLGREWTVTGLRQGRTAGDLQSALAQLSELRRYGYVAEEVDPYRSASPRMDQALANRSSIALLVEFQGASALLLADAHCDVVESSLERLAHDRGAARLNVDLLKLSHHGSRGNISENLIELCRPRHVLISTDSSIHGHPDLATIDLLARKNTESTYCVHFNYASARTDMMQTLLSEAGIRSSIPEQGLIGCSVELLGSEGSV